MFAGAVVSGTLSLDALQGSDAPFDPRIHHVRGHDGQARVAQVYRELLARQRDPRVAPHLRRACRIRTRCAASRR